jgi:hypothetical protein
MAKKIFTATSLILSKTGVKNQFEPHCDVTTWRHNDQGDITGIITNDIRKAELRVGQPCISSTMVP